MLCGGAYDAENFGGDTDADGAAKAAKLAAEATVAGLRGEVARLHAALERAGLHLGASRPIVETSDCMTSPAIQSAVRARGEDEGEEEVTGGGGTPSPTTPAPRDDSAMDADGVDADESVDKPQKRRVVEPSPAASIVFEYNPETKPSAGPFAGRPSPRGAETLRVRSRAVRAGGRRGRGGGRRGVLRRHLVLASDGGVRDAARPRAPPSPSSGNSSPGAPPPR